MPTRRTWRLTGHRRHPAPVRCALPDADDRAAIHRLRPRHPTDPGREVPVVPRRRAAAVEARSAHARDGARRRRARCRRSCRATPSRAACTGTSPDSKQPAMPMQGDAADAGRDRRAEAVDRRGRQVGWRRCDAPAAAGARRSPPSRTGRSPPRSATTGRSSCRCRRRCRRSTRKDFTNPIDRFLEAGARAAQADGGAARRSADAGPPRVSRSARPAADARGGRRVRRRRPAGRLGAADRHAARLAALRRTLGPALARRGALRRLGGFEYDVHRPNAWRYRDYVIQLVQRRQAVRPCS